MNHKSVIALILSGIMLMPSFSASAHFPESAKPTVCADSSAVRFYSDSARTTDAQSTCFTLGSEPDTILYGAPEEISVVNEDGTETVIRAANLNAFKSLKLFTLFEDGKASICTYDPQTRRVSTLLETGTDEITHMFAINDEYIEYLAGHVVYRYYPEMDRHEKLAAPADVFSFIPTSYGHFYNSGSSVNADLFFESTRLLGGVTWYTVEGEKLLFTADYESHQIAVADISAYFKAPTRSGMLELMQPYDFYGIVPVEAILNMDGDHECAHCADEAEHADAVCSVAQADEKAGDYKAGTPMPLNDRQQRIVNRATELVYFKWTPVKDLGKVMSYDENGKAVYRFPANKLQTGIPYMRTGWYAAGATPYTAVYLTFDKFNDDTVSTLEGFKRRVKDPNDDIFKAHAAYGSAGTVKDKDGNIISQYFPLYGLDCSAFVSYAWGLSARYDTIGLSISAKSVKLTNVPNGQNSRLKFEDLANLMPGDAFISCNNHTILVTAVYKEGNTIVQIDTMEETPPIAVFKQYKGRADIDNFLKNRLKPARGKASYEPNAPTEWQAYNIYRLKALHELNPTTPTPTPVPTPKPTPAPTPVPNPGANDPVAYVQTDYGTPLNLRAQPNPNSGTAILTTIPKGASFEVWNRNGDWYQARYDGKSGYVSAKYVAFAANVKTSGGTLNLREQANTSAPIVTQIPNGAELLVWYLKDGWYQTEYNGKTGYVSGDYIKVITDRKKVTVTLSGGVSPSTITVAVGQKYGTLPEPPKQDGYMFMWLIDGAPVGANTIVKNSNNHTLSGKWKPSVSISPMDNQPYKPNNKSENIIGG